MILMAQASHCQQEKSRCYQQDAFLPGQVGEPGKQPGKTEEAEAGGCAR